THILVEQGFRVSRPLFQRSLQQVMEDFQCSFIFLYGDEIVVVSSSKEEHEIHMSLCLARLRNFGLLVTHSNCYQERSRLSLAYYDRVRAIVNQSPPENVT